MPAPIADGESGLSVLTKINEAFDELGRMSAGALGLWDYWFWARFGSQTASAPDMFQGIAISTGTNTSAPPTSVLGRGRGYNSWGQLIRSSATLGSGWRCRTGSANHYFGAQASKARIQFQIQTLVGSTLRWGFHTAITNVESTDGCHLEVIDGIASLKTVENSVVTTHATTALLIAETPYTADIDIPAGGLTKRLRIYQEENPVPILDITLSNSQLTDGTRRTGYGFTLTYGVAAAVDIAMVYGMGIGTPASFARAME